MPPEEYFALVKAVEDEVGEPNLPILIGQAISAEAFDPPIFAAICSRDLNQAAIRSSIDLVLQTSFTAKVRQGWKGTH